MKKKLSVKEKLYLFELSEDTRQEVQKPCYTDVFADNGITPKEFEAMATNRQLHYQLIQHLKRCENQAQSFRNYGKLHRAFDEQVKKDILPHLYNGDEAIAEFYEPIRPIVIELINKFFAGEELAGEELSGEDFDRLWAATDENTYLAAEAFEELTRGERDVRQCENCKKLFLPTPRGRDQKYCSRACKRRDYYKKTGY